MKLRRPEEEYLFTVHIHARMHMYVHAYMHTCTHTRLHF